MAKKKLIILYRRYYGSGWSGASTGYSFGVYSNKKRIKKGFRQYKDNRAWKYVLQKMKENFRKKYKNSTLSFRSTQGDIKKIIK
jgi:hypothetical protein